MYRSSRQKIDKETVTLNDTLDQMDLMISAEHSSQSSRIYILSKCTWNTFWDRPALGHKTSLNESKKIEIISTISDQNDMKLGINHKKKN